MKDQLVCWKCGASLRDVVRPIYRTTECQACRADLHVCRLCRSYDPRIIGACAEERADPARDQERANFCDWFKPRANAFQPVDQAATHAAAARLDALFSDAPAPQDGLSQDVVRNDELERLFGSGEKGDGPSG